MAIILMLVNLVISFFNARSCGKVWAESKAIGGWFRACVWAGAIMAASGFTMVYSVVLAFIGVITGYIPESALPFLSSLAYILIIIPVIGSGFIILIESWIAFSREKSLKNLGVAGWNTFAQVYNTYNAINSFGGAWDIVAKGLGGLDSDDIDSDNSVFKVILLVLLALGGGILSTMVIIKKYSASLPVSEEIKDAHPRWTDKFKI